MTARPLSPAKLCRENANCNAAAVSRPEALLGQLSLRAADGAERPNYFYFMPKDTDPTRPPLVSVHGISRNVEEHARAFAPLAAAQRRLLIAPHFDAARFDGFQRLARDTESVVENLWEDIESFTGVPQGPVDMVGFSAGAQFTHRYAMLNPQRIRSQVLVAAGWFTLPSERDSYPYGVKRDSRRGRRAAENLTRFLALPTLVLVGARDDLRDAALRRSPDIDIKQGINRIERASRWSCNFLQAATRAGVAPCLQFAVMPDCGHAFEDCVSRGGLVEQVGHWLRLG
ncbi:alpha/beta hydrolase [Pelagibius sp. 7325]|uniref:alpha/beta hydrolase n=1 Tax=Pelagibius sp. 7325 TaxID=3131994 RepID=UPI0030EED4EE